MNTAKGQQSTSNTLTDAQCAVRIGEIEQENSYLAASLEGLQKITLTLRDKLHTVLRAEPEEGKDCGIPCASLCPAADKIRSHRHSVDATYSILEDILNRLEA